MAADVIVPSTIRKGDDTRARVAYDAMAPAEQQRFWSMVDGGTDKFHAINVIRSQRAQDAARATVGDTEATPTEAVTINAGNAATAGGIPGLAAFLGHGEGDTYEQRKKANSADLEQVQASAPIASSVGEGLGLALPALGGVAAGGAGAAAGAAREAPTLGALAREGAKGGALIGAPLGALQSDKGDFVDIAKNVLGGGVAGALTGGASALAPGLALRLAPSLGDITVSEAAHAPGEAAKILGGEALENAESGMVHGSSALARALAKIAPTAGKVAGGVKGFNTAGPLGAYKGAQWGGQAGNKLAALLNDFAIEPYLGGSLPVPSTDEELAAGLGAMRSDDGAIIPQEERTTPDARTIVDVNAPTRVRTPVTPSLRTPPGTSQDITPGRMIQFEHSFSPDELRAQMTEANAHAAELRAAMQAERDAALAAMPKTGAIARPVYQPEGVGSATPARPAPDDVTRALALMDEPSPSSGTRTMPEIDWRSMRSDSPANTTRASSLRDDAVKALVEDKPTQGMDLRHLRDLLAEANKSETALTPKQVRDEQIAMWAKGGIPPPWALDDNGNLLPEFSATPINEPRAALDPQQALALQAQQMGIPARFNAATETERLASMPSQYRQPYLDVLARLHGKSQTAPLAKRFYLNVPSDAPKYSTQPAFVRSASMEGAHTVDQIASGAPWQERNQLVLDALASLERGESGLPVLPAKATPQSAPSNFDEPSFVRKTADELGLSGNDERSATWQLREGGEPILSSSAEQARIKAENARARADKLPADRAALLREILNANGIGDHDSAQADAAYAAWKAGGRKGPKPASNLGGLLDAFNTTKDQGPASSLLEALERETRGMKTWRELRSVLPALAEALGVERLQLPDYVDARHIEQDAAD